MLSLSRMPVVQLTEVNYEAWRHRQEEIPGATPEIASVVWQIPHWEIVDTFDLCRAPLASRLAESDTQRASLPAFYNWLRRIGSHPTNFCETVAVMRHLMSQPGDSPHLVCFGTLWRLDNRGLYYAGWQGKELKLYPFEHEWAEDFLCPLVLHSGRPQHPLPGKASVASLVDIFA